MVDHFLSKVVGTQRCAAWCDAKKPSEEVSTTVVAAKVRETGEEKNLDADLGSVGAAMLTHMAAARRRVRE
jgi:hypothetical protein